MDNVRRWLGYGEVPAMSSMGTNPAEISVVKAARVDIDKLVRTGDSATTALPSAGLGSASAGREIVVGKVGAQGVFVERREERTRAHCGLCGMGIAVILGFTSTLSGAAVFAWRASHRLNVTFPLIVKQATWMMVPVVASAGSIHVFLADAMWSRQRSSFGAAWAKALAASALMWTLVIGLGTAFWRHGLKRTRWKQLYFKYPPPAVPLQTRLLETPDAIVSGMCWMYWSVGAVISHVGFGTVAFSLLSSGKAHYLMSPTGAYSYYCCPRWRREQIARAAGMELPKTS